MVLFGSFFIFSVRVIFISIGLFGLIESFIVVIRFLGELVIKIEIRI